jgi:hypothetical protein
VCICATHDDFDTYKQNATMIVCVYNKSNGRIMHMHPSTCVKSDTDIEYVDGCVGIIWDNKTHRDLYTTRIISELKRLYVGNNLDDVCMLVDNFNCKPNSRSTYKEEEYVCMPPLPSIEVPRQDVGCCLCLLFFHFVCLVYVLK